MKQPVISFRVIGKSGPLSFYWSGGPYGDALESKEGNGVIWLSGNGELLGVEFDDVNKENDHQRISIPGGNSMEVDVKGGTINFALKKSKTTTIPTNKKLLKQKTTN